MRLGGGDRGMGSGDKGMGRLKRVENGTGGLWVRFWGGIGGTGGIGEVG